jgi:hypothetical protein
MRTRAPSSATAAFAIVAAMLLGSVPSSAATQKLPDLGMGSVTGVRLDETTMPGHKLLRYDSKIVNIGVGTFDVRGRRSSTSQPLMSVTQRIFDTAGVGTNVAVPGASMYWAGDGHNHWHVTDLESGTLTRLTGPEVVGSLAKHGFHMIDDEPYNLSLPGAPHTRFYNGFRTKTSRDPNSLIVRMGLSVGWMDNYDASTNLQWIDVTGLAPGHYLLTVGADPNHYFRESSTSNNTAWAEIQLSEHQATVVSAGPGA